MVRRVRKAKSALPVRKDYRELMEPLAPLDRKDYPEPMEPLVLLEQTERRDR